MYKYTCPECGSVFKSENKRAIYCTAQCRGRFNARRNYAKNSAKLNAKSAERKRAKRASERDPYVSCAHCGSPLEAPSFIVKYCREACKREATKLRRASWASEYIEGACLDCGQSFRKSRNTTHLDRCTPCVRAEVAKATGALLAARAAALRDAHPKSTEPFVLPDISACARCREPFIMANGNQKYCTSLCRQEVRMAAQGCRNRGCRQCGTSLGRKSLDLYCDECRELRKKQSWAKARRKRQHAEGSHRQRAKKYGVQYAPVNRHAVYDRDGWTCGICQEPINQALAYPDPMSVSLDHVLPMSLGGPHVYENVQASHLTCNVHKGATVPLDAAA